MDKIICLGKNYAEHTLEMQEKAPERPVLFLKPQSSFIEPKNNSQVQLPWKRGNIHYECEIVLKLYKKMVIGLGLGLDLTLRDEQKKLKENGHPWEISKVFKNSAIVTPMRGVKDFEGDWQETPFIFKVNGEVRQTAKLNDANLKANEIIHYIDEFFPLCDGDLVFTGTPKGVGPLKPNDTVELIFGPIHHTIRLVE
ncbi:fumarylacetoacetate hydrolase family protein [Peredibacter starrii]|uniref:Fumarylacetoacetate hydrolase family protein n=1 Tax=Peredibacter starrii TaxID=28202 RepID=A0AAX4HRE2_9BACT|nr:fumarylacetoacetate hydrolase family protein [Peredibacter starrii]WPU65797.1 fumarylacetoacetate hydrolase family protein [Peredibacter starrii]